MSRYRFWSSDSTHRDRLREWGHLHWGALDEDMDTTIFLGFAEDLGAASRGDTFWPTSARPDEPG